MVKKSITSSMHNSIAISSLFGTAVALAASALLSCLLAFLINGENIAYERIGIITPVILYISHTLGGLIGATLSSEKKAITAVISIAASLFVLAAINILFMDSSFHAILPKILSGLFAYVTVFLILLRGESGKKRPIKIRPR